MPWPKQVYRRVCKEISANGKFEEEYLKVHGASAGKYTYNFANLTILPVRGEVKGMML